MHCTDLNITVRNLRIHKIKGNIRYLTVQWDSESGEHNVQTISNPKPVKTSVLHSWVAIFHNSLGKESALYMHDKEAIFINLQLVKEELTKRLLGIGEEPNAKSNS